MIGNISPLRYPGGKKKLTPFLAEILKINRINGTYIEPFAGGAGAALNLLLLEYVHNIVINDADYSVFCFWQAAIKSFEKFVKKIKIVKINLKTWEKQRNILENSKNHDPFEVGFAFFFLNRCNHSGIISAGPIGGFDQKGSWKIDARFNKQGLVDRIEKIHQYKKRISLYNLDAIEFLEKYSDENNNKNCFVYLDPPYYVEGKNLYLNYYTHEDHVSLSRYIQNKLKVPWILSYDNVKEINSLYKSKSSISYNLTYSANKTKIGNEVLFFSANVKAPSK